MEFDTSFKRTADIFFQKPIAQIIENGVCNSQCDFEKQASPDGKQNPITFSI